MNLYYYTWEQFDEDVKKIENPICDGFYPIPRGGFVLATALSHKFNRPILRNPTNKTIIVDDIADSGKTLFNHRMRYGSLTAITLLKRTTCRERNIIYAREIEENQWVVFPWENKENALEDYELYLSRQ